MEAVTPPRVFIFEDTPFSRMSLSRILEEAGCEALQPCDDGDPIAALEAAGPPVSLLMIPLYPHPSSALEAVVALRKRDWLSHVPILAISPLDRGSLDLARLRVLGVAGLIDRRAQPEHVRFRVSQVLYNGPNGRRFERAPCCLPVDVEVDGEVSTEYAISLSIAGMGIASSREIPPNTPVKLRFVLDAPEGRLVEAKGRAVHLRRSLRDDADYEVGVFFYPLPEPAASQLQAEVTQLLEAWSSVSRMDLDKDLE